MIKEIGQVIAIEEDFLLVETAIKSTCNTCAAKSNCGTSTIAQAFSNKSVVNKVKNILNAKVGESVEIGIPEASLLQGSFYLYMLPLLSAIFLACTAQFWLSRFIEIQEIHVILATFLGGYIGFLLSRYLLNKSDVDKYQPVLIRIYNGEIINSVIELD
ncbi:SoxR reducing system RseC family protein [Psychrosphaera sp. F3M07]|uniref:SoxR reducing system RseC family protein n=1 Tax=Psychrosphaera sp. F3M07 TaxID=2841560 RepID=UPI001C07FAD6|nr:SoxR reducing system RseC family protein [Psychrosphaera sp. F3M07]MBU2919244.1 SoxR reducing system RseC family protein [Psychrosphaera sp. F3M07]